MPSAGFSESLIGPEATIAEAIHILDCAGTGALVVCGEDRKLQGLLTDGDIRRAFLRGISFDRPCLTIATREPIMSSASDDKSHLLRIMDQYDVNHIPIVDEERRVVDLILRRDLVNRKQEASAVIMAGGFGRRLLPLTTGVPKPMLPVGDRPLMEHTIERLRKAGIQRVNITTHYLGEKIISHFGNGEGFGVDLRYVAEEQPLGTVGGLKLLRDLQEPLLVINGDIVTGVDFQNLVEYHREHRADLTMGVKREEIALAYGVVDCDGPYIRAIREKPKYTFLVNAGIYMLEPSVHRFIPSQGRFDMTELIQRLLDAGRPVVSFPIVEYWQDIGSPDDYERVQHDLANGESR
jgi:dTDP-glucose pyrophosphorylase